MKRKLWIGLVMVLLLAVLWCGVATAHISSGSCGDNVTYELNTDTGEMTVSGTGSMTDYESNPPWYNIRSLFTLVV